MLAAEAFQQFAHDGTFVDEVAVCVKHVLRSLEKHALSLLPEVLTSILQTYKVGHQNARNLFGQFFFVCR
jgi:hypothetical protein